MRDAVAVEAARGGGAFRVSPTMALSLLLGMRASKGRTPTCCQPMSAPRLTIGLVRRGHSETGGAEAYLKRLARGLSESGHATRLFTDAAWPAREWSWGPITRLRGETAHRFADELEKVTPNDHCDLVLSLERVWRCDVYRAGDGIHQAWMRPSRRCLVSPCAAGSIGSTANTRRRSSWSGRSFPAAAPAGSSPIPKW